MKILSQNKQQIINFEQIFKLFIENNESRLPQITAINPQGIKACLGMYQPKEAETVLSEIFNCSDSTFVMPRSQRYSKGHTLTDNDIDAIVNNFTISRHAAQRMVERGLFDTVPKDIHNQVRRYISNNCLAFWNEDGTANIAVDIDHYFVIQYSYTKNSYVVLTYNTTSENGYNIFDKREMASAGLSKKLDNKIT